MLCGVSTRPMDTTCPFTINTGVHITPCSAIFRGSVIDSTSAVLPRVCRALRVWSLRVWQFLHDGNQKDFQVLQHPVKPIPRATHVPQTLLQWAFETNIKNIASEHYFYDFKELEDVSILGPQPLEYYLSKLEGEYDQNLEILLRNLTTHLGLWHGDKLKFAR